MIIWLILANIRPMLRSFILQNSCSGSCKIPAAIKLAENIIPSGSPRMIYGFDVYAGKKYAIIIAVKYTIDIMINLVHTNFPYISCICGLSGSFSSMALILPRLFTAMT